MIYKHAVVMSQQLMRREETLVWGDGVEGQGLREGVLLFYPRLPQAESPTQPPVLLPSRPHLPAASWGRVPPPPLRHLPEHAQTSHSLPGTLQGDAAGGGQGERNGEAGDWGECPQLQQSRLLRENKTEQTLQPGPGAGCLPSWALGQPQAPVSKCWPLSPSLSEQPRLWEPTFSREGLSKLSIWLFSSLLRRRLQLEP